MSDVKDLKIDKIELDTKCVQAIFLGVPDVPGVAAKLFQAIATRNIGLNFIIQNPMRGGRTDLSFVTRKGNLDRIIPICRQVADEVEAQGVSFHSEIAAVTLLARDIPGNPQTAARVFTALGEANINVDNISATMDSITCIVELLRAEDALNALQSAFREELADRA